MNGIAGRPRRVVERCREVLAESGHGVGGARVLVVGVTYKPDVEDVRESPALEIIEELLELGAHVGFHDPLVPELDLPGLGRLVEPAGPGRVRRRPGAAAHRPRLARAGLGGRRRCGAGHDLPDDRPASSVCRLDPPLRAQEEPRVPLPSTNDDGIPGRVALAPWRPAVLSSAAFLLAGLLSALLPGTAAAQVPQTVVSITFDDGNADQLPAAQTLHAAGMKGTFYIPSGFVDAPDYLTRADLNAIAGMGHEIGGHTVTHPDLTTLPSDEGKRQICDDRVNLTNWGFRVTSLAYPFAAATTATETLAGQCGYNSARGLGDIQSRFGCADCPFSESMTPEDKYYLKALDQVDNTWTLGGLRRPPSRTPRRTTAAGCRSHSTTSVEAIRSPCPSRRSTTSSPGSSHAPRRTTPSSRPWTRSSAARCSRSSTAPP